MVILTIDLNPWVGRTGEFVFKFSSDKAQGGRLGVPQKVFTSQSGTTRIYDEAWTGDWWWAMQVSI